MGRERRGEAEAEATAAEDENDDEDDDDLETNAIDGRMGEEIISVIAAR